MAELDIKLWRIFIWKVHTFLMNVGKQSGYDMYLAVKVFKYRYMPGEFRTKIFYGFLSFQIHLWGRRRISKELNIKKKNFDDRIKQIFVWWYSIDGVYWDKQLRLTRIKVGFYQWNALRRRKNWPHVLPASKLTHIKLLSLFSLLLNCLVNDQEKYQFIIHCETTRVFKWVMG